MNILVLVLCGIYVCAFVYLGVKCFSNQIYIQLEMEAPWKMTGLSEGAGVGRAVSGGGDCALGVGSASKRTLQNCVPARRGSGSVASAPQGG